MSEKLSHRERLPEALRVLLDELPREIWEQHPEFGGLTRFWLERHAGFRRVLAHLQGEAEAMLDRNLAPERFAECVARFGSMFVNELHGHHQIEDHHYFPVLQRLEPRIARGFDLLDADHHTLDDLLARFVAAANGAIQNPKESVGAYHQILAETEALLDRHLLDEEDLIVPIILRNGEAALG